MGFFSLPKRYRLLSRRDFVNTSRTGHRRHTRHFVAILQPNGLGITRLGVTVSKKTGSAVKRNRVKRLIREFYRLNRSSFPQGYDIAVIAKKDASNFKLETIERELSRILFDKDAAQ